MGREDKASWKANYFSKLVQYLEEYPKCFIVGADNVGSKQMQQIRIGLRGTAVVLMGKNTMMRKAIKGHVEKNPALEKLLPHIRGNVGFVFTNAELSDVREKLLENKVQAPAKPGAIAPMDVIVPAQNTGLGPEKTSFFQALAIATKISKGTIEMINDVHILKEGEKVGASEATLLNMLNISPSHMVCKYSKSMIPAPSSSLRSWTSSQKICVSDSWLEFVMWLRCLWQLAIPLLLPLLIPSSTDSRTCWLLLPPRMSHSRRLRLSRNSLRILASSFLLLRRLLQLPVPRPRQRRRRRKKKNPKKRMTTWALDSLTKVHFYKFGSPDFKFCCFYLRVT